MHTRTAFRLLTSLIVLGVTASAWADGFIVIERPPVMPHPVTQRIAHFPLEVKRHTVTSQIRDTIGVTKVDQVFHNPNAQQMEGTYMFPLPETASVQKFSMWMDGKEVKGEVLDAEKARSIYEDIVRKMRDPALLEYVGSRLYKARVFPIPARGDVRIALEYTETIPVSDGLATYRYPLNTEKFSSSNVEDVVITVDLRSQVPLKNVFCTSHTVSISRPSDREARVGFEAHMVKPDRDFVVHYQSSDKEFGLSLLTYRVPSEDGFFMARLSPPFGVEPGKAIPKDVCFVLDTSGSMAGEKIAQAKKALQFCISSLRPDDRFNLIPFSTEPRPFRDSLVAASADNVQAAKRAVEQIEAAGGTDIHGALTSAVKARPGTGSGRPYLVVFLTDGQPTVGQTDPKKIESDVRSANDGKTRIFTFGVGHDLNAALLDRLTEDSRGTRDYIDEKEDVEVKVSSFFRKVADPVLSDIALHFPGADVVEMYPKSLPDLFHGSELVVLGRYKQPGKHKATLAGKRADETLGWSFPATFADGSTEHDFLPRLWATRKIGYLMDQIRLHGENKELKDEIIALAKRYAIVTPYTSYLVIEEQKLNPVAARPGAPLARRLAERERMDMDFKSDMSRAGSYGRVAAGPAAVAGSKEALQLQAGDALDGYGDDEVATGAGGASTPQHGRSRQGDIKAVGAKTFYLDAERWIDSTYDGKAATTKVKAFSDEYFNLLRKTPELAKYMAIGSRVLVVLEGKAYEVTE